MSHSAARRKRWRPLALSMVFLLAVPLAGMAGASHGNRILDLEPERATGTLGETRIFTARLSGRAEGIVDIQFENESGANDSDQTTPGSPDQTCRIAPGQTFCFVAYKGDRVGVDIWRAWIADALPDADEGPDEAGQIGLGGGVACQGSLIGLEPDCTDVVQITWTGRLACLPQAARTLLGAAHRITCSVRNTGGQPIPDTEVNVELTGANDPDGSSTPNAPDGGCVTGLNGACTITQATRPDDGAGNSHYHLWVDADRRDSTVELDRNESLEDPGDIREPDATDVALNSWLGRREVSIASSAYRVRRGRSVRLFGRITGHRECLGGQRVIVQGRIPGRAFQTFARLVSRADGGYSVRVNTNRTRDYRAMVPETTSCVSDETRVIRVRAV